MQKKKKNEFWLWAKCKAFNWGKILNSLGINIERMFQSRSIGLNQEYVWLANTAKGKKKNINKEREKNCI